MPLSELTRLAPSPTGALHLGNARTFLATWLLARQKNWRILLRIEDLDGPRIKAGADRQAIDDLLWLGLDWDFGPIVQSSARNLHRAAIQSLIDHGLAYPCVCSRREVELAASAPHLDDGTSFYPGTCRGKFKSVADAWAQANRPPAIRFAVPAGKIVSFSDHFAGWRRFDVVKQLGDFVIAKADFAPAYQLAVVVDDAGAGVTQVVRGDDLLDSTPRQILLYEALGWAQRIPQYLHLPLVIGSDGRRLAKRHGDTRLSAYRNAGISARRIRALLGRWLGIDGGDEISMMDLLSRFNLERVPRSPIVFGPADDAWLRNSNNSGAA